MTELFAGVLGFVLFTILSVASLLYGMCVVYIAFKIWGIDIEGFTA